MWSRIPDNRLPPKRQRQRSGIPRVPEKMWPRHERFVRSHHCSVLGCRCGPIRFAHIRSAANSGMGSRPNASYGIALCDMHHLEQHDIGQPAFERKYGLDLFALAAEFVRRSPDTAMKEALARLWEDCR